MARRRHESNSNLIVVDEVVKKFPGVTALQGVSVEVSRGALTLLKGPSGSGKTTLLNVMQGLQTPDAGAVYYDGKNISNLSKKKQEEHRAQTGQAFQRPGLLAGLSVLENIRAQHDLNRTEIDAVWTSQLCEALGVGGLMQQSAGKLSGGQAQRVALVRALAHRPEVLFADEPTSALDTQTTKDVHSVLQEAVHDSGMSVVMISHDAVSEMYADNVVTVVDGQIAR